MTLKIQDRQHCFFRNAKLSNMRNPTLQQIDPKFSATNSDSQPRVNHYGNQ